jgi:hypothetical protein
MVTVVAMVTTDAEDIMDTEDITDMVVGAATVGMDIGKGRA